MRLREFQIEAVEKINLYLEGKNAKVLYQLATGAGKTIVACAVAKMWDGDVYWLTHRRELERQSSRRLGEAGVDGVIVSSPAKMYNRIRKGQYIPSKTSLLVADEAHHASAPTWARILREWPGSILGLTATPWRLSKREGFDHLFDVLVQGPSAQELIDEGYLVSCIVKHPIDKDDVVKGHGNISGDYSAKQTWEMNDKTVLIKSGIKWLLRERTPTSRTVCYTLTVQHANAVNEYATERGLRSRVVLGETPEDERILAVKMFQEGELDLLVCVEVITEGFDVPGIDSILILRSTQSLSLYLQMIGRSMRPSENKTHALILDAANNWKVHGLPEEDRAHIWKLEARTDDDAMGMPPIRLCTRCHTINHASARSCKTCGKIFGNICDRCGAFIWMEGNIPGRCERCDMDDDLNIGDENISTIVSGRLVPIPGMENVHPDERWGVVVDKSKIVKEGMHILVTNTGGQRWLATLDKVVKKRGKKLYCKVRDNRRVPTKDDRGYFANG